MKQLETPYNVQAQNTKPVNQIKESVQKNHRLANDKLHEPNIVKEQNVTAKKTTKSAKTKSKTESSHKKERKSSQSKKRAEKEADLVTGKKETKHGQSKKRTKKETESVTSKGASKSKPRAKVIEIKTKTKKVPPRKKGSIDFLEEARNSEILPEEDGYAGEIGLDDLVDHQMSPQAQSSGPLIKEIDDILQNEKLKPHVVQYFKALKKDLTNR